MERILCQISFLKIPSSRRRGSCGRGRTRAIWLARGRVVVSPNTSLKQYGQYDLLFNCSVFVPYSQVCVGSACWVKSCDGG